MSNKFPKPLFILTGSPIQQLLKSPGTRQPSQRWSTSHNAIKRVCSDSPGEGLPKLGPTKPSNPSSSLSLPPATAVSRSVIRSQHLSTANTLQSKLSSPPIAEPSRLLRPDDTAAMRTEEPLLSTHANIEHTSNYKRPGRYFLPFTLEDYYKIHREPGKTPKRPVQTLRMKEADLPKKRETMEVRWSQERSKSLLKVKSIFS